MTVVATCSVQFTKSWELVWACFETRFGCLIFRNRKQLHYWISCHSDQVFVDCWKLLGVVGARTWLIYTHGAGDCLHSKKQKFLQLLNFFLWLLLFRMLCYVCCLQLHYRWLRSCISEGKNIRQCLWAVPFEVSDPIAVSSWCFCQCTGAGWLIWVFHTSGFSSLRRNACKLSPFFSRAVSFDNQCVWAGNRSCSGIFC